MSGMFTKLGECKFGKPIALREDLICAEKLYVAQPVKLDSNGKIAKITAKTDILFGFVYPHAAQSCLKQDYEATSRTIGNNNVIVEAYNEGENVRVIRAGQCISNVISENVAQNDNIYIDVAGGTLKLCKTSTDNLAVGNAKFEMAGNANQIVLVSFNLL